MAKFRKIEPVLIWEKVPRDEDLVSHIDAKRTVYIFTPEGGTRSRKFEVQFLDKNPPSRGIHFGRTTTLEAAKRLAEKGMRDLAASEPTVAELREQAQIEATAKAPSTCSACGEPSRWLTSGICPDCRG